MVSFYFHRCLQANEFVYGDFICKYLLFFKGHLVLLNFIGFYLTIYYFLSVLDDFQMFAISLLLMEFSYKNKIGLIVKKLF